ncbi:MAG: glycosyltransferase family 4 protein [Rhodoferax sp.]|nr:glycosyltransferase family 4 protein [Rhodoferax sp.]
MNGPAPQGGELQRWPAPAPDTESKLEKRLRIAVLNRVFSPTGGGAERYSIALVEQLAQRHEIHVFAQQIDHEWPGVTYHRVSAPLVKPRWLNQLWYATATWWATRCGFDVVHSHENTWHGQVQTVHVLPVKYNLFHGRAGWRLAMRWLKVVTSPRLLVYLWLERLRFSVGDGRCIVVTSKSLMTQMASTYPATARALRIVTPGVTTAGAIATLAQQFAARQRLGLPEGGFGILFVGNDYRKKGLETLIRTLQQLPDDIWLAVVGNAAKIPEFQLQAKATGVLSRVFFLGALNDVSGAYVASDCLAHPTLEDTFAMVVLEAMAHGLPVVVSSERYCGISGLLTPEGNALILAEPRDSKALADALLRLVQDSLLRQRLREAATAFAAQYQWATIALQQEAIYWSVLNVSDRQVEGKLM